MTRTEIQLTNDLNKAISDEDLTGASVLLDEWSSLFSTRPPQESFILACESGFVPIIKLFLSRGAWVQVDAIIAACESNNNVDILKAFLDSGWNINTCLGHMGDLLILCVDSPPLLRWAIANGANPNLNTDSTSTSALELAVAGNFAESVEVLIDMGGAQIHNTNALKTAARDGIAEMIELLLRKGLEINEIPFPEYSFNPNDETIAMGTALHEAADAGQLAAVQLLLEKGADPTLKNTLGKTALELAQERHHATVVKILEGKLNQ